VFWLVSPQEDGRAADDAADKPVEVQLTKASPEDALFEVASLGDINFMADATNLPADAQPYDLKRKLPIRYQMAMIAYQSKLTTLQYQPRLLLLWPRPDILSLARKIIAGDVVKHDDVNNDLLADEAGRTPEEARAFLSQYLLQAFVAGDPTMKKPLEIKVSQLPREQRATAIAMIHERLLFRRVAFEEAHFSADFWSRAQARLRIIDFGKSMPDAPLHLMVEVRSKEGAIASGIKILKPATR